MIEFINVSKSFGDQSVLKDVNFCLNDGEMLCVMGPSGSGKTTLIHILLGLITPDSGFIRGLEGIRRSAVFQEDRLIENLDALSNLRLVLANDFPQRRVAQALEALGLSEDLDKPVYDYSGGMKRRLAVARALLAPFDLLCLDEPFQGLDAATKKITMDFIKENIKGRSMVYVTHDPKDAKVMGGKAFNIAS